MIAGLPVDATLAAAIAGLVAAGIVKGATGIGYATFAMPLLANLIGLKAAMALIVLPAFAANLGLALTAGALVTTARQFAPLYLAMVPGLVAGAALLSVVDARTASMLLGIVMLAYVGLALMNPSWSLAPAAARRLQCPVGLLNGVVTGLTGSQVIPLVPYMMALHMDTARTVQAVNLGVLVLSAGLGLTILAADAAEVAMLRASLVAVPAALAGVWIGSRLQGFIGGAVARSLVLVVIALGGIRMIAT